MTQRRPPNAFDEFPDLVPDLAPAPPVARQQTSAAPALPPIEAPSTAPSEPPGPIDFGAAFDLDVVPKAAPVPAFTPSQSPGPLPSAPPGHPSHAPQGIPSHGAPSHAAPSHAPNAGPSYSPSAGPSRSPPVAPSSQPGKPSGAPIPAPPSSYSGFAPSSDPGLAEIPAAPPSRPIVTKEQLQDAARRAGEVSREVAGKTRDAAVAAALHSIGHNQEKSIRIEDPSTWLKPMLGPIVALGLAIVITIVAIAGGIAWLRYVAIACVLGAIGFGVARWFKLQADQ